MNLTGRLLTSEDREALLPTDRTDTRSRKILAPTDLSADSLPVVIGAAEVSRWLNAELILMTTISQRASTAELAHGWYADQVVNERRSQAARWFRCNVPSEFRRNVRMQVLVAIGTPAEAIVEVARAEQVDLIVMARDAHWGIQRFPRRSMTEAIIRAVNVPVLIVQSGAPLGSLWTIAPALPSPFHPDEARSIPLPVTNSAGSA